MNYLIKARKNNCRQLDEIKEKKKFETKEKLLFKVIQQEFYPLLTDFSIIYLNVNWLAYF